MSGPVFPFLSKLKRINPGANLNDYINNEMKQNLKAIEDALRKGNINFNEASQLIDALQSQIDALNAKTANYKTAYVSNFVTSSTSYVDVTGTNLSITTTGGPVEISLISGTTPGAQGHTVFNDTARAVRLRAVRDATNLRPVLVGRNAGSGYVYSANISWIDIVPAGTYAYKLQIESDLLGNAIINHGTFYIKEVR